MDRLVTVFSRTPSYNPNSADGYFQDSVSLECLDCGSEKTSPGWVYILVFFSIIPLAWFVNKSLKKSDTAENICEVLSLEDCATAVGGQSPVLT